MLFNSHFFIFVFLPVTLAGYFAIGRASRYLASAWLAAASLLFYGWWDPRFVPLLCGSIAVNYLIGSALSRSEALTPRKVWLGLGLGFNLLLLAYYKYFGFFTAQLDALSGLDIAIPEIVLPLGISFFTFTQIAFLVDVYRGEAREYRPVHYVLFVTFFPHLIAGPILHHKEMMPQFAKDAAHRFRALNLAVGSTAFAIGLVKKVVFADSIAPFATHVFKAADAGAVPGFVEAWGGTLAYTLQLYFDFSAYSDMAVGLAIMFGIRMPLNFFSPYKARDMIDFWRRWHMTLSRFLRDYLYIPLGGNRHGKGRRYLNLMITMVLGGFWHGAGWTFIAWGALHGFYLAVNHAWRETRKGRPAPSPLGRFSARLLTFLCVILAWVFFRAETFEGALRVLRGMIGIDGKLWTLAPVHWDRGGWLILAGLAIVWLAPNTYQILSRYRPVLPFDRGLRQTREPGFHFRWRATPGWAYGMGVVATLGLLYLGRITEFLYFRF